MATAAQIAANQANAQHSTGPRSAEGKARSAHNAATHGLTSRSLVVRDDEREEFETLLSNLSSEIQPAGEIETLTFQNLVHAAWTLRRCRRAETDLAASGPDPLLDDTAARTQDRIVRYAARAERSYYKALNTLQALQTDRALRRQNGLQPPEAAVQNEPIPPAASLATLRRNGWRPPDPERVAYMQAMADAYKAADGWDREFLDAYNASFPLGSGRK